MRLHVHYDPKRQTETVGGKVRSTSEFGRLVASQRTDAQGQQADVQ
jgi:hypothetical protein